MVDRHIAGNRFALGEIGDSVAPIDRNPTFLIESGFAGECRRAQDGCKGKSCKDMATRQHVRRLSQNARPVCIGLGDIAGDVI